MEAAVFNSAGNATDHYNLELFFESSPDILCIAGYDGYFKRINPTVSKVLGYTTEELFSAPINTFVHPEDQQITAKNRDSLTNNKPLLNFENRYITKSGEIIWLSWTSMPIDEQQLVFAIAKNITHKKKQEEDRNLVIASLTQTNNDLKQLTYTTSHDLRSPVSNLLTVFKMLDMGKIKDRETLEFVEMLKSATDNLHSTLNGYVDALTKRNMLSVAVEQVDLAESLNAVLSSVNSLVKDTKAVFIINFEEQPSVKFNKVYLESVFLNLITNSVKYTRPNKTPIITITSCRHNNVSRLIYSDEGQGFDMEKVKDRVFGFNQKFHSDETIDSKGIGLYLVYNHVSSLGGHISIDSELNKGASFTIAFRD
ncbi:PAS domain-containing sensor histidine kinase [Mucilaginibacter sp. PAMC 26640]|nr:PAS domain-containing sensor histidine kinase [Mucilaginibacter sp. PAMC 26640]